MDLPLSLAIFLVLLAGHDMDIPVQHIAIGDAVGGMTIIKVWYLDVKFAHLVDLCVSSSGCA